MNSHETLDLEFLRTQLSHLPKLTAPSPELGAAVAQVAEIKALMDRLGNRRLGSVFHPILELGRVKTACPFEIARRVIPFFDLCMTADAGSKLRVHMLVPTELVIGSNGKGYSESSSNEDIEHALTRIWNVHTQVDEGKSPLERAQYTWIHELGLAIAYEGKNRVSLFRRANEPYIPALVSTIHYPSPERITLLTRYCHQNSVEYNFAVLDNQWAFPLIMPGLTVPILTAYGVQRREWPAELPSAETLIRLAPEATPGTRPKRLFEHYRFAIDLNQVHELLQREEKQARKDMGGLEKIPCNMLSLEEVSLRTRWFLAPLLGGLATSILVMLLSKQGTWSSHQVLECIATTLFGLAFGLMCAPSFPMLKAPLNRIRRQEHR